MTKMMTVATQSPTSNLLLYSSDEFGYKLFALDLPTMKTFTSLPVPVIRYGLTTIYQKALLVGGLSLHTKNTVPDTIIWNIPMGTFEQGPAMHYARHSPFVINHFNESIYVVGGYWINKNEEIVPQQACEALNLKTLKWSPLPPLPAGLVLTSFLFQSYLCAFTEDMVNFLDTNVMEEGWKSVAGGGRLLSFEMPKVCEISNAEVLLFGFSGVEYLYNMEELKGQGRLSPVRINPQNTIVRASKINGMLVFDAYQNLWMFHCKYKKWKMVDVTTMTDEAKLVEELDKLSIN